MTKSKNRPRSATGKTTTTDSKQRTSWWSWTAIIVPVVALVAVVVFGGGQRSTGDGTVGASAPGFVLPATNGSQQSLDDVLVNGDALLYFSMGPGCDGCFAQIPEIESALAEQAITLVPIMVDPAPIVAVEAQRFGITTPILIDTDRAVSNAYGMIGVYGHADRPSHSFALVDQEGEITWLRHYAEMFVPTDRLLIDMAEAA